MSSLPIDIENLSLSDPESQGMKGSMGSQLDEVITKFIEDGKIQGAVVVVSRFDNPIYEHGFVFPDIAEFPDVKNWPKRERLNQEKASLGLISGRAFRSTEIPVLSRF